MKNNKHVNYINMSSTSAPTVPLNSSSGPSLFNQTRNRTVFFKKDIIKIPVIKSGEKNKSFNLAQNFIMLIDEN